MDTTWIFFALILIINAVVAVMISILIARKKKAPGSLEMSEMLMALAIWSFFYALTAITSNLDTKLLWLKLENVGIVSVPVFWFCFTARFTKFDKWLTRPILGLLWAVPIVSLSLLFSNHWFHWYYTTTIPSDGAFGPFLVGPGPWYYVQLVSTYGLLASGSVLLLWRVLHYRSLYRQQILATLTALVVPWIINALYHAGPDWLPKFDLTAIFFTLSALMISISVFRMQLFDLVPVARNIVMEHIPEMVLVVNENHRIIDANSVAQEWLQKPVDEIIGTDIFKQWPELSGKIQSGAELHDEVHIPGEPLRVLDLGITPLEFGMRHLKGHVIVAHDVSQRKGMEDQLKAANEALAVKLSEIESLQQQLREQAIRDPLTKVYNRRYLAESLDGIIARAMRENYPVSIIIMDVDHFKQFNDTYGHKCGDQVLEYLGALLMQRTRRSDIVCRYGGEEFVIVMANVPLEVAMTRANEWRTTFELSPLDYDNKQLKTTFSAGVASYPLHGKTGEAILQAADKALYESKHNGRNRVTLFEHE